MPSSGAVSGTSSTYGPEVGRLCGKGSMNTIADMPVEEAVMSSSIGWSAASFGVGVGFDVGNLVGVTVGGKDGADVGRRVGLDVGNLVGVTEGVRDGANVGRRVGAIVGIGVGGNATQRPVFGLLNVADAWHLEPSAQHRSPVQGLFNEQG